MERHSPRYTEGWAAGLVMADLSMEEEGDAAATVSRIR